MVISIPSMIHKINLNDDIYYHVLTVSCTSIFYDIYMILVGF